MHITARGTVFDAREAPARLRFCTFPTIALLESGRLVAGFRTGSSKDSPDEDVRLMASDDLGATWQTVFEGFGDYPPGRPRSPLGGSGRIRGIALTALPRPDASDDLLASLLWVDHADPTLPLASPETQGLLPTCVYVARSADSGRMWGALQEVPLAPHVGNATTGAILRLSGNHLALPYEAWKEWNDATPGLHHASLRLSQDGGATWPGLGIVAHDPSGRVLYWDQRLAVDGRSGELVALFWTHDRQAAQDLPIHIAWGSADGLRWTSPASLGIAGQIAAPVILPDGRLFAAYVHRHHPPSLRAILSDDRGRTWQAAPELIFYEKARGGQESGMGGARDFGDYWADMSIWTFGHPAPLLLPDGQVLVLYYAGDETAMGVHWVRITV